MGRRPTASGRAKHPPSTAKILAWLARHGFTVEGMWGDRQGTPYTDAAGRVLATGGGRGRDPDKLVEMEPRRGLLDMRALLIELEQPLGCSVDIVTEAGMHDAMRERVLHDAVVLEDVHSQHPLDLP